MMDINEGVPQWSTNFLTKNIVTLLLTQEQEMLLKINSYPINYTIPVNYTIIRKFKERKIFPCFRDHIWGADLADMQ